jgi:hypothetical protein
MQEKETLDERLPGFFVPDTLCQSNTSRPCAASTSFRVRSAWC